ncbi:putative bulb-type lectin domain-containing protein [Rosa chinensis]|uniref:Putative bulb-type lectin domain-containing protein n=1 Tax=Rosa chinensis TaxID=74649 RepID=A0A2P6QA40_ROSCH|nr:putative bulb-type lectin domain-containing protein [Rosa chinensis]
MLGIFNVPFQLGFYNTTPNAFTLALHMGLTCSESLFRWVWILPKLLLGSNTKTANKSVVGLKLLPTGNMVIYDSKGDFIWQSFDYPMDTLLVGQSLKAGK